ncbi:hypothetical protein BC828DRAFT_374150 [Blastocladiella britannica]|nr:hypothetical protein BC828DRAFT_374150 [Blastocladiella britannica]
MVAWNLEDKLAFITGGSSGLGFSIAKECVRRGAHVVIVARREQQLLDAVKELKDLAKSNSEHPPQTIAHVVADCTSSESIGAALDKASELTGGRVPYLAVCNAGTSLPRTFLDHSPAEFESLMRTNYMSAVNTSHAALRRMVDSVADIPGGRVQGKIVFVSSIAGVIGFTGYSAYSPTKAAIISLATCLRHEVLGGPANDVGIHTFLPGSIGTPGFEEEQKTKPRLARTIEKDDPIQTPDECSRSLFAGLDAGHAQITVGFNGELLRVAAKCHVPSNNGVLDFLKLLVAWFGILIWRRTELDLAARKDPAIPFATSTTASKAALAADDDQ